ncbi:hypothetical protein J6590_092727 [Homalodisca vitripennis]|nr:hypothetical protein J6590_092727 [Homalodisca vitripennis]
MSTTPILHVTLRLDNLPFHLDDGVNPTSSEKYDLGLLRRQNQAVFYSRHPSLHGSSKQVLCLVVGARSDDHLNVIRISYEKLPSGISQSQSPNLSLQKHVEICSKRLGI